MTFLRNFIRQSALTSTAVLAQPAFSFSIQCKHLQHDQTIHGYGAFKCKVKLTLVG